MSRVMSPGLRASTLYAPAFEHDSCGFGLIADIDNRASRALVDAALTALSRLAHRGAVGADGLSGDGCGLAAASAAGIPARGGGRGRHRPRRDLRRRHGVPARRGIPGPALPRGARGLPARTRPAPRRLARGPGGSLGLRRDRARRHAAHRTGVRGCRGRRYGRPVPARAVPGAAGGGKSAGGRGRVLCRDPVRRHPRLQGDGAARCAGAGVPGPGPAPTSLPAW